MKQEFKKFNLEEALAGKPVVTREGKPVTQLVKFEDVDDPYRVLVGVVDRNILAWSSSGMYSYDSTDNSNDLFMAPEKKWTNLYYDPEEHDVVSGEICSSKEEALEFCSYNMGGMKYIDTICFDVE